MAFTAGTKPTAHDSVVTGLTSRIITKWGETGLFAIPGGVTVTTEQQQKMLLAQKEMAWGIAAAAVEEMAATGAGDWVQVLSFGSGWTDWGDGTHGPVRYRKDALGQVHLAGLAKNTSGTFPSTIFTLPVGFRPTANGIFAIIAPGTSAGAIRIGSSGVVQADNGVINQFFALDGIYFSTT